MREILFRGKSVSNNEWVEGFYEYSYMYDSLRECHRIIWADKPTRTNYLSEVISETVGQYTGLKDKNGKKIFEGDIVRTQPFSDRPYSSRAKYKQHIGVVEYRVNHFKNSLYEQDYEASWQVNIKDYGKYGCCDWSAFFKCEVIGNIHDNPELLEGN